MWGIERDRLNKSELLGLPGIIFEMDQGTLETLAAKVDAINELLRSGYSETIESILIIRQEIDYIIVSALGLSQPEISIISDVLLYGLDFFQDGKNSLACSPVEINDLEIFAKAFCGVVNSILRFGQTIARATVYHGDSPLQLVSIHLDSESNNVVAQVDMSTALQETLAKLEQKMIEEYSDSVYIRRNVKIFDGHTIHIVRPNEKRFWSCSSAFRDADELLATSLKVEMYAE